MKRSVVFGVLFLSVVLILSNKGLNGSKNYKDVFFDDDVHQINIEISQSNWEDILNNPLEEKYHNCDIVIDGETFKNVGIRTKGNTSLKIVAESGFSERYSFKINFGKYDKNTSFYGLDELCLNNVFADATYMREYLSYDMFEFIGAYAPLSSFVNISVNGEPRGLYIAVESVDMGFLKRNFGEDFGSLYKPESDFLDGNIVKREIKGEDLVYTDDNFERYASVIDNAKTDIRDEDKRTLINSLRILNTEENIESVVDIEETLKFWVAQNVMCSFDSYIGRTLHNYYLYEKDGCLSMIPWDYNLSFGGDIYGKLGNERLEDIKIDEATNMVNASMLNPVHPIFYGKRPFFEKTAGSEKYRELYIGYITDFLRDYFDSGYFDKKYDSMIKKIKPYIEADSTAFYSVEEVEKAQTLLKEFITLRVESIKGQLNGEIIDGDYDTYIDASQINMEDMGHHKNGYMHKK